MWPACRLPIVGTSTTEGSGPRRLRRSETVWRTSTSEAVLGTRERLRLHRLHVGLDRGLERGRAGHEVLHEARLAARIEVEDVVEHEHLAGDVQARADADGGHLERVGDAPGD